MIAYSCCPLTLWRHLLLSRLFALLSSMYLPVYTSRANFLLMGKLLINNKKMAMNSIYAHGQIDQLLVFYFPEESTCQSQ